MTFTLRRGLIIFIIITIIISLSGCINNDNNNKKNISYIYEVDINPDNEDYYYIKIPIPINEKNFASTIVSNIKILEGNCNYSLNLSNEVSLDIYSNNKLILKSEGDIYPFPYYSLSLRNTSKRGTSDFNENYNGKYVIFCNKSNEINQISIKINAECKGSKGYTISELNGNIKKNGINYIYGTENHQEE